MTETKHTPAPWYYRGSKANASHEIISDVLGTDVFIASTGIWSLENRDEQTANARLIAAAPDMYAALQNILNGIETGAITSDHEKTFANAIRQAREAIKRAEGE